MKFNQYYITTPCFPSTIGGVPLQAEDLFFVPDTFNHNPCLILRPHADYIILDLDFEALDEGLSPCKLCLWLVCHHVNYFSLGFLVFGSILSFRIASETRPSLQKIINANHSNSVCASIPQSLITT